MKYFKLLVLLSLFCNSCIFFHSEKMKPLNMDLSISKISGSIVRFRGMVKNPNPYSEAILINEAIYTNQTRPDLYWFLIIKYNDSLCMRGSHETVCRSRPPEKKDYTILSPNEQKEIDFDIDFKELRTEKNYYKNDVPNNSLYGTYTIQLDYHDYLLNHPLAIDSIRSNKITYEYKKIRQKILN